MNATAQTISPAPPVAVDIPTLHPRISVRRTSGVTSVEVVIARIDREGIVEDTFEMSAADLELLRWALT